MGPDTSGALTAVPPHDRSRGIADVLIDCQSGSDEAWSELVTRYERLVFSTALRAGLDEDAAADVFQRTWVELHRSLLRIRDAKALPQWLIVTTRRLAYKHAVESRKWVDIVREDLCDTAPGPDSEIVAIEERDALEAALARLDERCRDVLTLMFFSAEAVSYRDVAKRTGLSEDSVGSLKSRCLRKLRGMMESRP